MKRLLTSAAIILGVGLFVFGVTTDPGATWGSGWVADVTNPALMTVGAMLAIGGILARR